MSLDVNLDKVKSSSSGGTIDRLRHPTISTGTSVVVKYIYKATSIGAFCLVSFFSPKDVATKYIYNLLYRYYVQMQFSKWTAPTQGRKQAKNQRLKHQYVSLSFPKMEQSNQRTTYVIEQTGVDSILFEFFRRTGVKLVKAGHSKLQLLNELEAAKRPPWVKLRGPRRQGTTGSIIYITFFQQPICQQPQQKYLNLNPFLVKLTDFAQLV